MTFLLALLGLLIFASYFGIRIYNRLVELRNEIDMACVSLETLLTERNDELPKFVDICNNYRQYDSTRLQGITTARGAIRSALISRDYVALGNAEGALRGHFNAIMALTEAYPQMKTDKTFMQLKLRLHELEESIEDQRSIYNNAILANNVQVKTFPDNLIARKFHFDNGKLLKISTPV